MKKTLFLSLPLLLAACETTPENDDGDMIYVGVIQEGVECPLLVTDTGTEYSIALNDYENVELGDRVRVEADMADMSFCQQGAGHLVPSELEEL